MTKWLLSTSWYFCNSKLQQRAPNCALVLVSVQRTISIFGFLLPHVWKFLIVFSILGSCYFISGNFSLCPFLNHLPGVLLRRIPCFRGKSGTRGHPFLSQNVCTHKRPWAVQSCSFSCSPVDQVQVLCAFTEHLLRYRLQWGQQTPFWHHDTRSDTNPGRLFTRFDYIQKYTYIESRCVGVFF